MSSSLVVEHHHDRNTHNSFPLLVCRIFEIAPGAQDMFTFGCECESGSEEMYASEEFKIHARGLFGMVDAVVRLVELGRTDALADALITLGSQHYRYGVRSAHYPIVGKALIYTLKAALKDDYTSVAHNSWTQIYSIIFTGMSEGAYYEEFNTRDIKA